MLKLRPYQEEAVASTFDYLGSETGNPLIVLPTGTGKSLVIATLCQQALQWPDTKILIVTHVKELIAQNYAELLGVWPDAPAGVNSAGIGRRDYHKPIIFCGVASVAKQAHKFGRVDLVLVDEAHMIPRSDSTLYGLLFKTLKLANPNVRIIGLTATPYRLDSGRLDEGEDAMFDGVAYDYDVLDAVKQGYLSPVVSKATELKLDVTGVGTRGGEFIAGELERAVDKDELNERVVNEIVAWAREQNRKQWLIFGAGVDHCRHLAELVRAAGYSCETIFGETPKAERDHIIRQYKAGRITALCSMGVLTTGFNAPAVDLVAMVRPTKSTGLYVQIVGRGMRLAPGKTNCLVLDFAGNVTRHGPIDAVNPKRPGKGDGEAPTKECPSCASIVYAAARVCPDCGHEFPEPEPKIAPVAAIAPVLSSDRPEWVKVDGVTYARHRKEGKPDSMVVTYRCGMSIHREWVCFEHQGFARTKAISWWTARASATTLPATITDALARAKDLKVPDEIAVKRNGKFTEIVSTRGLQLQAGGAGSALHYASEEVPF